MGLVFHQQPGTSTRGGILVLALGSYSSFRRPWAPWQELEDHAH